MNARPSPLRHVVLAPLSILVLAPFYLVVVNSFKTRVAILGDPWSLPVQGATLENYQNILSGGSFDVVGSYARSTVITVSTVVVLLLVAAMLAYWVARSSSPIASIIQLLLLMGLIIPPQVTVIPVVKLLKALGLLFTIPGLVAYDVAANLPFTAFVYVSFIRTIPKELEEAAAIDGAGILTMALRVVAPLLAPVTLTLLVLLSVIVWNDFVDPLLLLGAGEGTSTVTTGIYQSVGNYTLDWGAVFGYSVLGALPTVLLFLGMQRYIVGGLTAGALK